MRTGRHCLAVAPGSTNDNRPDPEFQALVRATYAGNPPALTALGARLVAGQDAPRSLADGEALMLEAASHGDAEAWHYLSVFAAAGIVRPPCWQTAWDALNRAVEGGHAQASVQLALLAEEGIRSADDASAWLSPPEFRSVKDKPRIAACENFIRQSWCDHLLTVATPRLKPAMVYDVRQKGLRLDPMRTNRNAALSVIDTDFIVQMLRARIARAAAVSGVQLEPPEILHYAPGEQYRLHVDFFHRSVAHFDDLVRDSGQRVKTVLVYLNHDYDGGETEFPSLGIRFRGRPGEALLFENVGADGEGDMQTAHAGLPVSRGRKWLFSQWIRDRPQRVA